MSPAYLLAIAFCGVALVVLLIVWAKIPAFLALATASLAVGLAARMPLPDITRAFQSGVGDTLGFVAMVIALGTVIGKLLAESGGAVVVSRALANALGERRLDWALMLSGFIIGLPVFFQVGLVLLAPVLFTAQRQTKTPLLRLGLPLVAGLSAAHGLVPPHPGPLAAIERLGADPGRTLFYSLIVGLPVSILSGPLYARYICRRVHVEPGAIAGQFTHTAAADQLRGHEGHGASFSRTQKSISVASELARVRTPSLTVTLLTMLLPVLLMLLAALAQVVMTDGTVRRGIAFIGSPLAAMLVATLVAMYTFGRACGFTRARLLQFAEESLPPIAGVLLVVGAGGGFGRVLDAAEVDTAIAHAMGGLRLSPLVMGWVIASLLRLSVGSATVSVITAASIMAPLLTGMPDVNKELLVVAIGAGSLIMSHVNDGGFWLVKEYLNMSVPQTVATWSIVETIIAVTALAGVLLLALVVG
jgi:gluconate:H+ symporter, GntP family